MNSNLDVKEYVLDKVKAIIAEKRRKKVAPVCATKNEILTLINADVLSVMRALVKEGKYKGAININKDAMLIDNDKTV